MFSTICNAGTFPRSSYTCFPPRAHSTDAEHKQTGLVVEPSGANTKIFAYTVATLAAMYAMKILLDVNRKVERLERVYPPGVSKARDGRNRPRMLRHEYLMKGRFTSLVFF